MIAALDLSFTSIPRLWVVPNPHHHADPLLPSQTCAAGGLSWPAAATSKGEHLFEGGILVDQPHHAGRRF